MTEANVREAMTALKIKNCEGVDRIPQGVIAVGMNQHVTPFTVLFDLIYKTRRLPEQWLLAKVIPIHKNCISFTMK